MSGESDEIDRDALETERDFLLRSLDDLEAEREAGNVDDGTYQELRDDYTARAAAVIRSLDTGTDLTLPDPPPPSKLTRVLTIGGILVFAIVAAFLLTHAVGQRHPGQTITGNAQVTGSASGATGPATTAPDAGKALAAAVKQAPTSYAANIAYARYLLQSDDFTDAVQEFGAAARIDPSQPEPPTYAGFAGALVSQQITDPKAKASLLAASIDRINDVIKKSPKYPDAYALKGVILFDFERDPGHAIPSFQQFLLLTNDSNPLRAQVLQELAKAEQADKAVRP